MTDLTRRAALRGITATAATTAVLAIPAAASSSTDPEAVLAAWRSLRDLTAEWRRLDDEMWEIREDLPLWVKQPRILLFIGKPSGTEFFADTVEKIENHFLGSPWADTWSVTIRAEQQAKRDAKVAELEDVKRRAAEELERSGWGWRDRRQDEIDVIEGQYHAVINRAVGTHPIIIAAKMWQALYFQPHDAFEDYPQCCMVGAIRGLLPELPGEMQAAMRTIANAEPTMTMVDVERELALA
jgi:hypothetical protein